MIRIGKKDKHVIDMFVLRVPATGHKLSTDGNRLDGHWMGGNGIAEWADVTSGDPRHGSSHIWFNDLGSRAAQTVQNYVRKVTPPRLLAERIGRNS